MALVGRNDLSVVTSKIGSMILRGIASRFGEQLLSSHKFSVFDRQYPAISFNISVYMLDDAGPG